MADQPTILIVDDNPAKMTSIEAVLTDLPCRVVLAKSGTEALHQCLEHNFAMILLDVQMPVIDGFETAVLIRQRNRSEHTPIVFITSTSHSDLEMFKGYSIGAVDYILTPIIPEVLRAKVKVFLDLFIQKEEIQRQAEMLRETNEELKRSLLENQQLSEGLEAANKELEERTAELKKADKAKSDFLASMSHELCTAERYGW